MDCKEIRELLSGYIDDVLEQDLRAHVEKHLEGCNVCLTELGELQVIVKEVGSIKNVSPPDDFLDQLHKKMAPASSIRSFIQRLFVPFKIKIPLQFAATAAICVLVFFVVNTPEIQKELSELTTETRTAQKQKPSTKAVEKKTADTPGSGDYDNFQRGFLDKTAPSPQPGKKLELVEIEEESGLYSFSGAEDVEVPEEKKYYRKKVEPEPVTEKPVLGGTVKHHKQLAPSVSNKPIELALLLTPEKDKMSISGKGSSVKSPASPIEKRSAVKRIKSEENKRMSVNYGTNAETTLTPPIEEEILGDAATVADEDQVIAETVEDLSRAKTDTEKPKDTPGIATVISEEDVVGTMVSRSEKPRKPETLVKTKKALHSPDKQYKGIQKTLQEIINSVNGKLLATTLKDPPRYRVEIPTENYALFCKKLNNIGRFISPPPPLPGIEGETVQVIVKLTNN